MNNHHLQRKNPVTLIRNMFAAALVLTWASTLATHASAQNSHSSTHSDRHHTARRKHRIFCGARFRYAGLHLPAH